MPGPEPHPIYTAFVNHPDCILTDTDRQALQTQRGFPNEVIDAFRFRSARPENAAVVTALLGQFERDDLLDSGLLVVSGGQVVPNEQVLQAPGVLIPYPANTQDGVSHLRRHKMGFKGHAVRFYPAGQEHDEIILAESEFKAVAAHCYGYRAIGIPGISSFAREHFGKLTSFVTDENITRVIVCFDNEIKNDPALPNFKPDPDKRWDTQYYAALMAQRLGENLHIETAVATLPDEWRVNGKIDIDGALAQGRTAAEFSATINGALRVGDYVGSLPEEGQNIVNRKLRAFELSLKIRRGRGGYEVPVKQPSGETKWQEISNFTFNVLSKIETPEGIVREVRMKSGSYTSNPFRLTASDMVRPDNFQTAFYKHGNGEAWFRGSKDDLIDVFELEHARGPCPVITEPDHVGKIIGQDMWLFGSAAIIHGDVILPDSSGIVWNQTSGFVAPKYANENGVEASESKWTSRIPHPDLKNRGGVDLKEIARRLHKNFGGDSYGHNAVLAYIWALSCAWSNDFFESFGCFPILYLSGPKESGKSTLAKWLLRMFGIMSSGFNATGATNAGIVRTLAYYSSIPVLFDECREDTLQGTGKESLLRSAYDRQPVVKASREGNNAVVSLPVRAPIMLAGEHVPGDQALASRCLFAQFSKDRPGYGSEYDWLEAQSRTIFPRIVGKLLLDGPATTNLVNNAETMTRNLQTQGKQDPRVARNHGIVLATYLEVVDKDDELKIGKLLMSNMKAVTEESKEDSDLHRFFEDLVVLREDGEIKRDRDYTLDGATLWMNLRRCWEAWEKSRRSLPNRGTPSHRTALNLLKQTRYIEKYNHTKKFGGNASKAVAIKLDINLGCPQALIDFAMPE